MVKRSLLNNKPKLVTDSSLELDRELSYPQEAHFPNVGNDQLITWDASSSFEEKAHYCAGIFCELKDEKLHRLSNHDLQSLISTA